MDDFDFDFAGVTDSPGPDGEFEKLRQHLKRIENALGAGDVEEASALMGEHVTHLRQIVGDPVTESTPPSGDRSVDDDLDEQDGDLQVLFGEESDPRSLAEGRASYVRRLKKITCCPLCMTTHKVYPRKFSAGMARALIVMSKLAFRDWITIGTLPRASRLALHHLEYAKLEKWGLIEVQKEGEKTIKGVWRLTDEGREFVRGRHEVYRWRFVYDNRLVTTAQAVTAGIIKDQELVTIFDALGDRFDYDELMGNKESTPRGTPIKTPQELHERSTSP